MTVMTPETFTTPDLFDECRDQVQVPDSGLMHFGGNKKFIGQAVTVTCPDDNSFAVEALKQDGTGKVLVIDGNASKQFAFIGDIMADNAIKNNWAGVIVNACCRDIEILSEMDLAVMALGVTPRSTVKKGKGETGQSVSLLNTTIEQGDWIYGDLNGILISKSSLI